MPKKKKTTNDSGKLSGAVDCRNMRGDAGPGLVHLSSYTSTDSSTDEASLASPDFTIPPSNKPCILPGKKLNLRVHYREQSGCQEYV